MVFCDANHVSCDQAQQPAQNQGDDGDEDQVRKLASDELLSIRDPFIEHFAHEPSFSKQTGSHRNQQKAVHPDHLFHYLYIDKGWDSRR